jgi:multidrug resistance protein, MATE family
MTQHLNNFISALKKMCVTATPIVVSRVAIGINMFICMLLIAKLGHAELAAGALINAVYYSGLIPLWQLFFAVGILAAQNYGAKNYAEIGSIMRQGLLLSIFVGLGAMLLIFNIKPLLILLGQNERLATLAQKYFDGYAWGIIPGMWNVVLGQFFLGIAKQKLSLICTLITIPLIITCGYILMFGKFGCPHLGIIGMGYANTIAFVISNLGIFIYIYCKKEFQPYKIFVWDKKIINHYFKEILIIGWPITLMFAAELTIFSLATIFAGWLGETSLAAWQITLQINLIVFMFPMGIGQAGTIVIGQAAGGKNYSAIRYLAYAALFLGTICIIVSSILYFTIPKQLIAFYLDNKNPINANTIQIAVTLLVASAAMNLFDSWRTIAACALRGLRDTMIPMWIFVALGTILCLPCGYLFGFPLHLGAAGIRWGFVIGFAIGAGILLHRMHKYTEHNFVTNLYESGD